MQRTVTKEGDIYTVSDKYPPDEQGGIKIKTTKQTMADIDRLLSNYQDELTFWTDLKAACLAIDE